MEQQLANPFSDVLFQPLMFEISTALAE